MPEKTEWVPLIAKVFANMRCFVSFCQMSHSAVSELLTPVRPGLSVPLLRSMGYNLPIGLDTVVS